MGFEVNQQTVALVTGGNRGIGKAIVKGLLERGAQKIYAAVRNVQSAEPLVEEYGDRVVPVELDLSKPSTILQAAVIANDVNLVVNNAGVLKTATPLADDVEEALNFEMDVNVLGLIRMAKAFSPVLIKNGGGGFAQLNSVASMNNFANFATYSASKAAAYSITQALKTLLDGQGVQVVSVHPGPIDTDMANSAGLGEIAEPPSLVADELVAALAENRFHAFPDSMAKQVGQAYQGFAESVIEAEMTE